MEDQLVQYLADTQQANENIRRKAELDLRKVQTEPGYPVSIATIAKHKSLGTPIRQAAITNLRQFIENNWSGENDNGSVIAIADAVKAQIRPMLLELALSSDEERIVKSAASYAVGKMANVDFPDQWQDLLPTLMNVIQNGTDGQLHGALKVLGDLVEESLTDEQFFSMARDIIKVVYEIALNDSKDAMLRALAVSVFRNCFDLMDQVKEDHPQDVRAFADETLKAWFPFFLQTIRQSLPERDPSSHEQPESWNGFVALKHQVVKCLLKIKTVFSQLLLPETPNFFQAVWDELQILEPAYEEIFVDVETATQGRLEASDRLPYTVDLLALEELDFLNNCLKASPVQKQLEALIQGHSVPHETPWIIDLMKLATSFARITHEEQDLWEIDVYLYIAEEASVSANYTPRTACADLLIKLGEWQNERALMSLYSYSKTLFGGEGTSWRKQEAALYLLNMLLIDFIERDGNAPVEITNVYLELVDWATNKDHDELLRARGYLVGGTLAKCNDQALRLVDRTIDSINSEESEIVQIACIKAVEGFLRQDVPQPDLQHKVVNAIAKWLGAKDMTDLEEADDLLCTLAETLRSAINLNKAVAISPDFPALDLLFLMAKHGAANFQLTMLICETFEDMVAEMRDPPSYQILCAKVLPSLTAAFEVADVTANDPLLVFATELMASLTQYGSEPLPPGIVAATLPKLNRLLMESDDGEILRPGAETVRYILAHDHQQMFSYQDENGRSGLEVCLHIIDRLLGPNIEDNAASEVGGLAAELVEKAGHERLGPFLPQLLQAVANRLATAEASPFIQSLILVFARLSLLGANDVVEFLGGIDINGQNGLQVVLGKWLENAVMFAGYDEIRQNVIAISKLYSLNDPRVAQTAVKGDLIIPTSDRIMTRSRTKQKPDQYTIIPAPLKMLKVLIEELLSASGVQSASKEAANIASAFADENTSDDGWEDDPDSLDLGLGPNKSDLMGYLEAGNVRYRDDETQAYLIEFFLRAARENVADFGNWYGMLSEEEKAKLTQLATPQSS